MKQFFLFLASLAGVCSLQAQNVAHLSRYAAANETLPAACGPRVVLYGDSITDGWATRRPEFFEQTGFIGRGISGEETAQMLLRFRQDVIGIHSSAFVLLGGINDIAQNMGDPYVEDLTYANILSMIDLAWQNGVRPVICALLPSYSLRWRPEITDCFEKVQSLNARLKAYCRRHGITFIDYAEVLAGPDGRILPEFSGDSVHPNDAGYARMERHLLESLR